jgi:hypothetical protein
MISHILLSATLAVMLLAGCGHAVPPPSPPSMGAATLRPERGMTEQMTTSAVGVEPTSAQVTACGQQSRSGPFVCKTVIYGPWPSNWLAAILQQTPRGWLLAAWTSG